MVDHLPERLDLYATAEAGREYSGHVELASLERVLPLLVSDEGSLEVRLKLGKREDGTRYLEGSISGSVRQRCDRCLEPMIQPIELEFRLGLVHGQEEAAALGDDFEPLMLTGEPTRIANVVTDEVLLALPIVPVHADLTECRMPETEFSPADGEGKQNPFAVLEQLKQKH
jgi:uncharacterized protein